MREIAATGRSGQGRRKAAARQVWRRQMCAIHRILITTQMCGALHLPCARRRAEATEAAVTIFLAGHLVALLHVLLQEFRQGHNSNLVLPPPPIQRPACAAGANRAARARARRRINHGAKA